MLRDFLNIYEPIKVVINNLKSKAFKNKKLILTTIEVIFLNNILNIISIFIKATTKLQAENYPIIYYIILKVYKIYKKLDNLKTGYKVSLFFFPLKIINKILTS
jgi:hypothetical protein